MTECGPCGEFFVSTTSFDKHRVGKHWPICTRRCLERHEMQALGMELDSKGRWGSPLSEHDLLRLGRLPASVS